MKQANQELIDLLHGDDEFLMADLFTITLSSGRVLRYTNADVSVVWQGQVFDAHELVVKRGATRVACGLDVDGNELEIAADPSVKLEGLSWSESALGGTLDGARVKIERAFFRLAAAALDNLAVADGVVLEVSGNNRTLAANVSLNGDLPSEFVLSCDIALKNATSIYGKPYPRIGAEVSVTYTDNSVGYFGVWFEEVVRGNVLSLERTLSQSFKLPENKTVGAVRSVMMQARYITSESVRIGNLSVRPVDGADGLLSMKPVGTVVVFSGRVSDVSGSRSAVKVSVKSDIELLNVASPRNIYQAGCMRTLYDGGCQVNRDKFTVDGRVTADSANGNTLRCNLVQPDGWFNQGVVKFTSGRNAGLTRTVKTHQAGVLDFALRLPYPPQNGDVFKIYPGCDKRQETCQNKFQNVVHFRGFPYIPSADTIV